MPYRTKKYTAEQDGQYKVEVLSILADKDCGISIAEIQAESIVLTGVTSQKIARILNNLVEMGLVQKAQSRATGRMKYMAVSRMLELGFSTPDM